MRIIWAKVVENGKTVRKHIVLDDRKCKVCGNEFTPYKTDSMCCSRKCFQKSTKEKVVIPEKTCTFCNKTGKKYLAHHYATNMETGERLGLTLCPACHSGEHYRVKQRKLGRVVNSKKRMGLLSKQELVASEMGRPQ